LRQKPEILTLRSNEILTAVIHGARKEELSPEVQLAAIHALFNSLEFVRDNFEREVRFTRFFSSS
jgi:importin subunit beta-1